MSELVVFTARENFDFLKFGSRVTEAQKASFKADCENVQRKQRVAAIGIGTWALELRALKEGGVWEDIINPKTGFAFYNEGFGAFCNHAFEISPTAASDLVRVAQFFQESGIKRGILQDEYKGYNYSKLVELAAVPSEHRKYFSPEMTREEIRTAKDYVKNSAGFRVEKDKVGFDLLTKAQEWKDNGKKTPEPRLDVIPGQIELEDISDSVEVVINQHADLANDGEEEVDIYDMPMQTHSYDNDEYDELDEAQADMQADMQTIEEDSERSLPPVVDSPIKKYDFSTRDNIRMFLDDYKNWHKREDIITPYTNYCYWFTLPNFDILYAFELNIATAELLQGVRNYETFVSYYIFPRSLYKDDKKPDVFEVSKRVLENYLMAHRDELKRR